MKWSENGSQLHNYWWSKNHIKSKNRWKSCVISRTSCINVCFGTSIEFILVNSIEFWDHWENWFLSGLLWNDAFPFHLTHPKQLACWADSENWQRWISCYHRMSGWQSAPSVFVHPSITAVITPAKWTPTPHHCHFISWYLVDILSWKCRCNICHLDPFLMANGRFYSERHLN